MVQYAVPRVWVSVGGNRKMGTMWDERAKISLNTHTEILSEKQRDSTQGDDIVCYRRSTVCIWLHVFRTKF